MGATIGSRLNLIDVISSNKFLKELYPSGFSEEILLGRLCLDIDNISLNIHTRERPAVHIKKWGEWGKNYHVLTFELIGSIPQEIKVFNWQKRNYCIPHIKTIEDLIYIDFYSELWNVNITLECLIFQKASSYLE